MKQKLIYLFSLMLLCIMGTSGALAGDGTLYTWDFSGGAYNSQGGQGGQYTFASAEDANVTLDVDATNGKFSGRDGDVQVNATTIIKVPVKSAGDVITITNYSSDGNQYNMTYSIGSETGINLQTKAYTVSKSEATTGYVSITVTADGYAKKIAVLQHDEDVIDDSDEPTFTDFQIDFQTNPYTVMLPTSGTLPSGVTVNPGSYNGSQHGVQNPTITVEVYGPVKFTIGSCQYGSHTVTITDSQNNQVQIDNNNGCDNANQKTKFVTYTYNNETPTTLTFAVSGYLPFFYAEACDLIQNCKVSYYDVDGTTLIGTETVDGNSPLSYAYGENEVTVASGSAFRGWFNSTGSTALKVVEGTVITDDISLYAKATEIEVAEGGKTFDYDLTKNYFYAEDHELFSATNGVYYNNHGWKFTSGGAFSVNVAGKAQVILTLCEYSNEGIITVTDGNGDEVGTIASGKAASDGATATFNYDGDATTLTFTFAAQVYLHGVTVKNIDTSLTSYEVTFKNGDVTVDTYIVYEGMSVGTLPSAPSLSSDQVFIGWYTATDGTGTKVTSDVVPTENVTYYANIIDITKTNGYVVVDNSGNDRRNGESFKAAMAYANANSGYNVFLPNGTYDLGDLISANNPGVTITRAMSILGESMDGTIIKAETEAENESINSAAVKINNGLTGVYLQNLTIQNYPKAYNTSTNAERALALWDRGTQTVLKNVYLKGTQDVYYTNLNGAGQQTYYEGGKIEGTVDFICGAGDAFFESVNLHAASSATYKAAKGSASTTYIAAPATYESEAGYVFNNCTITGESDQANRYYLVRTWQNAAKTTYINADYSACAPHTDLYKKMNDSAPETTNCHSYTSADAEAANYTPSAVLGSFYDDAKNKIATFSNTVTVGTTGFATIGFPYATTIPEGVTAYAITGLNGSTLTTTKIVAGSKVAANTGLMISAKPGDYTFAARPDGVSYNDNILVATGSEIKTGSSAGEFYFLTITDNVNKKVGWKLNNAGRTLRTNTAYILATSISNSNSLSVLDFTLDGDATAIGGVSEQAGDMSEDAYNVIGQRVSTNAKGVVIVNGIKMVNQ